MTVEASSPYTRPRSVLEAASLMSKGGACLLAGGTDLVMMRSEGSVLAERLVDLKGIDELNRIDIDDDLVSIGACVRLDDLARNAPFPANAICDGAAMVGGWQTRTRATIGGNICRASPAGDTLCGLLVLDCLLELASTSGSRLVPAAEFFIGPGRTAMRPDEILTRVLMNRRLGGSAYERFTYRNAMDLSVAGVAVSLEMAGGRCRRACIAIGACGPRPILVPAAAEALIGSTVDAENLDMAVAAVVAAATPIDDVRGTRKHRLHVLRPLTVRATKQALERALERSPC